MPQHYLSRLIQNSPLECTAVFQHLQSSCGKDVNRSQKNTAQGQSLRWPTKSERGGSNCSVLQIFPSNHCKISISPHKIHVLVRICFLNMFQIAVVLCEHAMYGCQGKCWVFGVENRVDLCQMCLSISSWQCYIVPPALSHFQLCMKEQLLFLWHNKPLLWPDWAYTAVIVFSDRRLHFATTKLSLSFKIYLSAKIPEKEVS